MQRTALRADAASTIQRGSTHVDRVTESISDHDAFERNLDFDIWIHVGNVDAVANGRDILACIRLESGGGGEGRGDEGDGKGKECEGRGEE